MRYPNAKRGFKIPKSVRYINGWAFEGNPNLKDITIPSNIDSIGFYAFANCSNLTNVRISSSCKVNKEAFQDTKYQLIDQLNHQLENFNIFEFHKIAYLHLNSNSISDDNTFEAEYEFRRLSKEDIYPIILKKWRLAIKDYITNELSEVYSAQIGWRPIMIDNNWTFRYLYKDNKGNNIETIIITSDEIKNKVKTINSVNAKR